MAKTSTKFYSSAVSHHDAPDQYLGSFAMPGEAPQWVMRNGRVVTFKTAEEAELAGFRILASKLNGAQDVQEFVAKRNERNSMRVLTASPKAQRAFADAESVFTKRS